MIPQESLTTLRTQIAQTAAALNAANRTAVILPLDDVLQQLQDWITLQATRFEPEGYRYLPRMGSATSALGTLLDVSPTRPGQLTSLLCWLLPDHVFDRLKEQLEQWYAAQEQPPIPAADRHATVDCLTQELYALELLEEQTLRALEAAGQPAPVRRGDIHHLEVVVADLTE